jgi:hypothetical protein
LVVLKKAEL